MCQLEHNFLECEGIKYCLADAYKICTHFCHMEKKNESFQGSTREKPTTYEEKKLSANLG